MRKIFLNLGLYLKHQVLKEHAVAENQYLFKKWRKYEYMEQY